MAEKLRVLFAAAEVAPFAKVGGLADVASGLPRALSSLGADARVIVPRYGSLRGGEALRWQRDLDPILLRSRRFQGRLFQSELPGSAVPVYFVENPDFFGRAGIYSDPASGLAFEDNFQRFVLFMKAVLVSCRRIGWTPDVIHCNDWQTGLLPAYLKVKGAGDSALAGAASLYTVHNLAYQGQAGMEMFGLTGLPPHLARPGEPLELHGSLNPMKAGILFADAVNTVSPTYAREIQESPEFGCGLENTLRRRAELFGILNGIDTEEWNPATDSLIPAPYDASHLERKLKNKTELQRFSGLRVDAAAPLVGMVARLVSQKGVDLLLEAAPELLSLDLQFVLLGTGEEKYQTALARLARFRPSAWSVNLSFDNRLAHWIEAASDMFLMPSRYEPCGLNQMYSLRYGTVPIVRHTGGLADTVRDCLRDPAGNGFKFYSYASGEMLQAVRAALAAYRNRQEWQDIMRRGMREDFSWRRSARRYLQLYEIARREHEFHTSESSKARGHPQALF